MSCSSTEAEYRTLSTTACEMKWIAALLGEMGVSIPVTPRLYCDNLSAVYLSENPALHNRSKHFDTDFHYVHERVALGALVVQKIPASHQLADIFTKSLPQRSFINLRSKLGVFEPPATSLRGCVSNDEPKTKAFLTMTVQQEIQGNKVGLELKDKESSLQLVSNGKAAQRSCHSTINTAQ